MAKSLGIYIDENSVKYSKVDKTKDDLKVESYGTYFYDQDNLDQTLDRIVQETFSMKDPICINISNETYNYFEVFSALKASDQKKSIDLDFELACGEKGISKDEVESRFLTVPNRDDSDKLKVLHVSTSKENLSKTLKAFGQYKVTSASPISSSVLNLTELVSNENNVIIVNIEDKTKITTVLNGGIYNITTLDDGMNDILSKINVTENSFQKSYECVKNTTIYTQDADEMQMIDDNEHIDDVISVLYKICYEVKTIIEKETVPINKVLITGAGTVINNVDLYFQEYIPNVKCELLKPYFIESSSIKTPIKEYIEVNSATALALEGLGYGIKDLNFKSKSEGGLGSINISLDSSKEITNVDKTLIRILVCIIIAIIAYASFSNFIINRINEKTDEATIATTNINEQIEEVQSDIADVSSGVTQYNTLIHALTATDDEEDAEDADTDIAQTIIKKDSIPNLLNRIVYIIPEQVKVTSIENTTGTHIVIEAQASKYEQIGYFKAAITNEGVLTNVKSSSGSNSGGIVTVTIEGDLP